MSLVTWAGFGPFAQVCRTKSPQHWSQKLGHETGDTIIGGPPVTTYALGTRRMMKLRLK